MPPNNGLEDNVEYVEFETGEVRYHGSPPVGETEQRDHGYARAMGEGQEDEVGYGKPDVTAGSGGMNQTPAEVDAYDSLTRDEMRGALAEHGIEHDLAGNASKAKYLAVYREHFDPPGDDGGD